MEIITGLTIDASGDIELDIVVDTALFVTAVGNITAVRIESPGQDISLTSGTGDVLINYINAGTSTVTLEAARDIREVDADEETDLTAGMADLTAGRHIGSETDDSLTLETALDSLRARSTGLGSIFFNESDDIELILVSAADGAISINSGGRITILVVESLTDSPYNAIELTALDGDILIGLIDYQSGDKVEMKRIGDNDRVYLRLRYNF